jgi:predicted phosphodiesterase
MSDLHGEFGPIDIPVSSNEKDDICILAGDIGLAKTPATYLNIIEDMSNRFREVIYIVGNHEFYGANLPTAIDKIRSTIVDFENVELLENETRVYDNIAFVCATMWTSFNDGNPHDMLNAQMELNDYRKIRTGPKSEPWQRKLLPCHTVAKFYESKEFIFNEIIKHKAEGRSVVVVTHQGPSYQSVAAEYSGDRLNPAYVTELSYDIMDSKPDIWIHGHTHVSFDYMIDDTRVICNPYGYRGSMKNPDFNPILEVIV